LVVAEVRHRPSVRRTSRWHTPTSKATSSIENLRPGEYWLVAFGKDFRNQLRKGILVEVGKTTEVVIVAPKEPTQNCKRASSGRRR
jgi:hypothetical protein